MYEKIRPFIKLPPQPLSVTLRKIRYLSLLLIATPVIADTDWSMCQVPVITQQSAIDYSLSQTSIVADQVMSVNQQLFEFSGNVLAKREQQSIQADFLRLDKESGALQAKGNTVFSDHSISLTAQSLSLDDQNNTSQFDDAEFQLFDSHFRGKALSIAQLDENQRELHDVSYTTCDPGNNSWSLSAGKLSINQFSGLGTATHTVLRIQNIPVFYFPWFQFPIDDRRMSGILAPTFSSSNAHGTELAVPIYWNQAENYDMTLTPINYSKRGIQLNSENRYLLENHLGQLDLSYIDDDRFNDQRWFRRWQHESDFLGIHASLLNQQVSDQDFLQDFEHLSAVEDVDFLKSSLLFSSTFQQWNASLLLEEYDTVDPARFASRPYKRLPQVRLDRYDLLTSDKYKIQWLNEYVSFDKEASTTGKRLHVYPSFSIPIEGSYYFLNPQLTLDFTHYQLDNTSLDIDQQRSIPLFSVDSGLFFERLADQQGKWLHTLEPRLYMLYVPYEDQSGLPLFDTSLLTENYANLFVNNRFSGADRIGDARQISLGITTRFLQQSSGREVFSASIGQAYYAADRKVSVGSTIDSRNKSPLMSLLRFQPTSEWEFQLSNVFDQQSRDSAQTDITLRRIDQDSTFNVEYHFRENSLEQSTLSFVYPINQSWTGFAKKQYSLRNNRRPIQNLLGFAYESCCWAFKILYEEDGDDTFTDTDYSVFFQLTFKGLTNTGKDIDSFLEESILGYQSSH